MTATGSDRSKPMVRIELQKVTKRYGRLRVFRDLAAEVRSGQVLVLAGRNGSGKSTLLRVIAGLSRPTMGRVVFYQDGRPLAAEERRRLIGLVAVDVAVYGELSAWENLSFFAQVRGLRLTQRDGARLLAEVGLAGREDDLVQTYSSGLCQRLKFACGLLHRPPFLLLDEPGANLDEAGRAFVERLIGQQRERGLVVLATNEPREVAYGDVILRLGEDP